MREAYCVKACDLSRLYGAAKDVENTYPPPPPASAARTLSPMSLKRKEVPCPN
jgi:hypothetical protein